MNLAQNRRVQLQSRRWTRGIIGLSLGLLLIAAGAGRIHAQAAGAITDTNVAQRIADAKTPADYEALAAYYRAQAAAEGDQVKLHEAMAKAYGPGRKGLLHSKQHCDELVRSSKQQQKVFEEMAAEEEKMAKELSATKK